MTNPVLEKFQNLESKMHQAVKFLEIAKEENKGVLPEEYSNKAHQIKKALEDLKEQAIKANI